MTYKFSALSKERLEGVHPDLKKLFYEALEGSPHDFSITEGVRSQKRQKLLVEAGKSQTMNSRHLTGHAVDFCIIIEGKANWELEKYHEVTDHIKNVARKLDIPIVCGIDWKTLKDGPHVELDRRIYK